jgi:hypothetical protein
VRLSGTGSVRISGNSRQSATICQAKAPVKADPAGAREWPPCGVTVTTPMGRSSQWKTAPGGCDLSAQARCVNARGWGRSNARGVSRLPAPVAITDARKPNHPCDWLDCATIESVGARESDPRSPTAHTGKRETTPSKCASVCATLRSCERETNPVCRTAVAVCRSTVRPGHALMNVPFATPGSPKTPPVGLCRTDQRWGQRATRFTE